MPALVDTNILVYRFDPRCERKQAIAADTLRRGLQSGELCLAHQSIIELVAAVSRPQSDGEPLLEPHEVTEEVEELLGQFELLYPTEDVVRLALRGLAAYQLSWFDAHLWAYAEHYGCEQLISENFQHGRTYGAVRVSNPFLDSEPD